MPTLVLVRHAKSDWGDPSLDDHDRPLNDRGRRDAPVMAERLAASGASPDLLVTSTALRAQTTAGFFAQALGLDPIAEPALHAAPPREILRVVAEKAHDASARSVVVVAHNPGLSMLAGSFAAEIAHLPTCAVARFTWPDDVPWDAIDATDPSDWTLDTPR